MNNNRLYRKPVVLQEALEATLSNGVAPDGTVLSDVTTANPIYTAGPSPFTVVASPTTGTFGVRSLGTAMVTLDLATAARGLYYVSAATNLTATYTTGSAVTPGRSVSATPLNSGQFAYDPVSENVVGNGDFELYSAGWSGAFVTLDRGGIAALINLNSVSTPDTLSQTMELAIPQGQSEISITARVTPTGAVDLSGFHVQAILNGTVVADFANFTSDYQTYSATFLVPALEGVEGVNLQLVPSKPLAGIAGLYFDTVSITAVPEPTGVGSVIVGAVSLVLRRRR